MPVKRFCRTGVAAALVALVAASVALASSPPLPHPAKGYTTGALKKSLSLIYIISADAKRIVAGPAHPPLGSQFAISDGSVACPKAKRAPGFSKKLSVIAFFGLPGATFKLSHGKYGFSASRTIGKQTLLGSNAKAFKLELKFTGTVTSPTAITGKLTVRGGPCTRHRPIAYTAKLNNKILVAPGQ
jgi:hypothetical protein